MYSIQNIIVGIPITDKLSELVDNWERDGDSRWSEWEDFGFETLYHGGAGSNVGFCGVLLGEFDECGHYVRVEPTALFYYGRSRNIKKREIPLIPTQEQLDKARKLVDNLLPELRELCPEFGVYCIFSTS